jgi:hypothetical protein
MTLLTVSASAGLGIAEDKDFDLDLYPIENLSNGSSQML